MKKILCVLCAVALLFALCVPAMTAFAENSPSGEAKYNVTVKADDTTKGKAEKVELNNGDIKATATPNEGAEFYGWEIKGNKYTIVSGSLSSKEIVIKAESDVELIAKFTKEATLPGDNKPTAPETNDVGVMGAIAAIIAFVGCAVVLKKRAFN